jgi:glutamate dehydrogenase/leucine dehydrogenase
VGAANNQLADPTCAASLQARGILYAPDFCVSIGGAMAIVGVEAMGWSWAEAEAQVGRVHSTLLRVFELAAREGITTESAARRIAESRLEAAAE